MTRIRNGAPASPGALHVPSHARPTLEDNLNAVRNPSTVAYPIRRDRSDLRPSRMRFVIRDDLGGG